MKYLSTRGGTSRLSFSEALSSGLAPDGGLFVPERFPTIGGIAPPGDGSTARLAAFAAELLEPFLVEDPLWPALPELCRRAFSFPIPTRALPDGTTSVLDLFHGPTAAFKDVGARFLAACCDRLGGGGTVLVATSGDTGGAVAAAFSEVPGAETWILFPRGRVSARQRKQLTTWGRSARAFAVEGDFDACQALVKRAFADEEVRRARRLISANSINIGRLLPQLVYYAAASLQHLRRRGVPPGFVIPSGNLGNAVAAFWALRMGFPIRRIALAFNANRAVPDFFATGEFRRAPTLETLASAMDVGAPSNFERLTHLYGGDLAPLRRDAEAHSVDDAAIGDAIEQGLSRWGSVWCPHTAAAVRVRERLGAADWIVVATAHPAKFETIVEPRIGRSVEVPPTLAAVLGREERFETIAPDWEAFRAMLLSA